MFHPLSKEQLSNRQPYLHSSLVWFDNHWQGSRDLFQLSEIITINILVWRFLYRCLTKGVPTLLLQTTIYSSAWRGSSQIKIHKHIQNHIKHGSWSPELLASRYIIYIFPIRDWQSPLLSLLHVKSVLHSLATHEMWTQNEFEIQANHKMTRAKKSDLFISLNDLP